MRPALLAAALAAAAAGCAPRGVLTGSPILGRTRLADLEPAPPAPDVDPDETEPAPPRPHAPPAPPRVDLPPALTTPSAALHVDAQVLVEVAPTSPGSVVISRLPAPHRAAPVEQGAPATADAARALVGRRDPREPLGFALAVAAGLAGAPPPSVTDGPALVAWAEDTGAWAALPAASLEPGDLLVLDRAVDDRPASLIAVVLGTDARGVTDVLYLARGVIRRGHVDPARPTVARDRTGAVVNSFVRHGTSYPPTGTRYLAGELAVGRVRLPRPTSP
ncbi:MAG TPA: hypothetical protein VM734_12155 [Kofleriaceae bacterium]|nr:hypothetical protein [Kofleriaceae bacterium]